jgi:hypothetical protein
MKDDKAECQEVIKLIEKHWKSNTRDANNGILEYTDYCIMWEKVLKKKHIKKYNNKIIKKTKMADYLPYQMANEELKKRVK